MAQYFDDLDEAITAAAKKLAKKAARHQQARAEYEALLRKKSAEQTPDEPMPSDGRNTFVITFEKIWDRLDENTANTYAAIRVESGGWWIAGGPKAIAFTAKCGGAASWDQLIEFVTERETLPGRKVRALRSIVRHVGRIKVA